MNNHLVFVNALSFFSIPLLLNSPNRRSLYTQIFDLKKLLVKTFEGVYIVVEAEDDSCWKKCLSRLYSSHHVHPTAAKQKKVHPSRFLGRNINVSVNVMCGISYTPDGGNVKMVFSKQAVGHCILRQFI